VRVKLDENLPASLGEVLTTHGHDVDTVLAENLGGHPDPDVAAAVKAEHQFLITLDKGFGDIRAYPPGTHPGILVLRLLDESPTAVRQAVTDVLAHHRLEDLAGTVTVFHRGRLRIRLP
jgi:predicted nuclease of predicted toxin-antitoxin system